MDWFLYDRDLHDERINCKVAYRFVRADSVADDTVLMEEKQESDNNDEQNFSSLILEERLR